MTVPTVHSTSASAVVAAPASEPAPAPATEAVALAPSTEAVTAAPAGAPERGRPIVAVLTGGDDDATVARRAVELSDATGAPVSAVVAVTDSGFSINARLHVVALSQRAELAGRAWLTWRRASGRDSAPPSAADLPQLVVGARRGGAVGLAQLTAWAARTWPEAAEVAVVGHAALLDPSAPASPAVVTTSVATRHDTGDARLASRPRLGRRRRRPAPHAPTS